MSESSTEGRADPVAPASDVAGTTLPGPMGPPSETGLPGWSNGQPVTFPLDFGRYRLERKLGQGGMGCVYLATDTALLRPVAVKIPNVSLTDNPTLRERFHREGRVAANLHHPNICPVHDVGSQDGVHFLVMAFIDGKPLSAFIRPGQKLPARNVVTVVRCLALAMHEAHTRGVIHRDLKPANIMIAPSKQPIIMDFGLARRLESTSGSLLTQSGVMMGTPEYMPPEQIDGDAKRVGPRSDVYALGVILYELLAGRRPFQGALTQLIVQVATYPPPALRQYRPDIDKILEAICRKALAKTPEGRFADMQKFAAALTHWLTGPKPTNAAFLTDCGDETLGIGVDATSDVAELFEVVAEHVDKSVKVRPRSHRAKYTTSVFWTKEVPEHRRISRQLANGRRSGSNNRRGTRAWWIAAITAAFAITLVLTVLFRR